jgi:N-acetylglucosamine kinase-like BadF-type ATPase
MGYILGVDGGATGTIAVLADEDGTILHHATGRASNFVTVGETASHQALKDVVWKVVDEAGSTLEDCRAAVFGLAGLNHPSSIDVYRSIIHPIGLPVEPIIEGDIVIAWAAATACEPGVVVIAGTGSSAFGVNAAGERVKALGWDYIVADQGSGYWVGLHGIQAAIKVWDGRLDESSLLAAMVDHYQLVDAGDMVKRAHEPDFDKGNVASFARRVSICAREGDLTAIDILNRAGDELGQAACAVIKRLGLENDTFTVGQIGGTFRSGAHLTEPFANRVHMIAPKAVVEPAQFSAAIGAVIYAHYQRGTLTESILQQIKQTSGDALRWKS